MASLNGTTVLVIGGSSGIGFRVAQFAQQRGARLLLGARNHERLGRAVEILREAGGEVESLPVDAHSEQSLRAFFEKVSAIDHLVSLIGEPMGGGFLSAGLEEIRHTIESKFFANVLIARLAAPKLREGASMTFTSGTGGRAQDAAGSYVGNLAVKALVEGLGVELAPRARANAVAPTWTETPLWDPVPVHERAATRKYFEKTIPLHRLATLDELASAYIFLMENSFVTGQQLAVDGGITLGS